MFRKWKKHNEDKVPPSDISIELCKYFVPTVRSCPNVSVLGFWGILRLTIQSSIISIERSSSCTGASLPFTMNIKILCKVQTKLESVVKAHWQACGQKEQQEIYYL